MPGFRPYFQIAWRNCTGTARIGRPPASPLASIIIFSRHARSAAEDWHSLLSPRLVDPSKPVIHVSTVVGGADIAMEQSAGILPSQCCTNLSRDGTMREDGDDVG